MAKALPKQGEIWLWGNTRYSSREHTHYLFLTDPVVQDFVGLCYILDLHLLKLEDGDVNRVSGYRFYPKDWTRIA